MCVVSHTSLNRIKNIIREKVFHSSLKYVFKTFLFHVLADHAVFFFESYDTTIKYDELLSVCKCHYIKDNCFDIGEETKTQNKAYELLNKSSSCVYINPVTLPKHGIVTHLYLKSSFTNCLIPCFPFQKNQLK